MKFSIITPTYNREHTLERLIESVLNQSYQEFELIIIDDGSTDKSRDVVQKYLENPKIRYIELAKNSGVNRARNIGFDAISEETEWVTLLDSDDTFLPEALALMKKVIEEHAEQEYFRFSEVNSEGKRLGYVEEDNFVADYRSTVLEEAYGGWTVTLSRNIVEGGFRFEESVNGFESLSWFELSKTTPCLYSLEVVKLYLTDTESLTRPSKRDKAFYENQKEGNRLIYERFASDMKCFGARRGLATVLYELGKLYFLSKDRRLGFHYTLKAMGYNPWNLRIFRNLLLSFKTI